MEYRHDSVLVKEVVEGLCLRNGAVVVDGTLGLGGHAKEMLKEIGKDGVLVGFDCDELHLGLAKERLSDYRENTIFIRSNFVHLKSELLAHGINSVDAVLFDLGIASPHVDDSTRGFSFQEEGPLDMRLDDRLAVSASDIVNEWSIQEMARIFREYGEERAAMKIARAIVEFRDEVKIETTKQLSEIVLSVVHRKDRIHPATRVFQALRIAVNKELEVLEQGLEEAMNVLGVGGRLVVISYHSLEDRIVKKCFQKATKPKTQETMFSLHDVIEPAKFRLITKKPIVPTDEELGRNPRSRSAKLRIVEKI